MTLFYENEIKDEKDEIEEEVRRKLSIEGDVYACGCKDMRMRHGGYIRTKQNLTSCPYCNTRLVKDERSTDDLR